MEATNTSQKTSEDIHVASVGERSTGKPAAKAKLKQTSNLTLSHVSVPYRERQWVDIEPGKIDKSCLEVSTLMIRLLRHDDSIHREEDGAVRDSKRWHQYFAPERNLPRTSQFEYG